MLASIPCKATSRIGFNQISQKLDNLGLFGVPQKIGRALGRNSARSIVPRDIGCSHQRKRAKNKRPADRKGRPLFHLSLDEVPAALNPVLDKSITPFFPRVCRATSSLVRPP